MGSWDLRFVRMNYCSFRRVSPALDTGYECICDLNLVENWTGAPQSDPSDDLRIKGGGKTVFFLASKIIFRKGRDSLCNELCFGIQKAPAFIFLD